MWRGPLGEPSEMWSSYTRLARAGNPKMEPSQRAVARACKRRGWTAIPAMARDDNSQFT